MISSNTRGVVGLVIFTVGFTAGATVATLYYLNRIEALTSKVNVKINEQYIVAEVANTEAERDKGLSGRESLGLNEGMYFIFEKPGIYGIWMKGMKIPIDIIWISEGKIIGFEENIQPPADSNGSDGELKNYISPGEVDRVLELHAGRVKLLRTKIGDYVMAKPLIEKVQ